MLAKYVDINNLTTNVSIVANLKFQWYSLTLQNICTSYNIWDFFPFHRSCLHNCRTTPVTSICRPWACQTLTFLWWTRLGWRVWRTAFSKSRTAKPNSIEAFQVSYNSQLPAEVRNKYTNIWRLSKDSQDFILL